LAANKEMILLYWEIGKEILARQKKRGWGAKVIDYLSKDLRRSFPEMKGFSPRNLKYMRTFAEAWPDKVIVQQSAAQLPWFHHCILLDKVKDPNKQNWYLGKALEYGWSRNVLVHQIESGLYERQGKAVTNFSRTLPPLQSDLAGQALKDPYVFDFLDLHADSLERDLERKLMENIREFLLELGVGFAFVGSRYHLEISEKEFYLDLLFYHLRLRCFIVIDLKMGEFKPEYAGKMNFYLSAVDDLLRNPTDGPSIGLVLCKQKDRVIVEYALRDTRKPIGVSAYELTPKLPARLRGKLPTVEQLESKLADVPNISNRDAKSKG